MSYILTLVASSKDRPITDGHIKNINKTLEFYNLSFTAEPIWLAPGTALDLGISDKAQSALMEHLRNDLMSDKIDIFCVPIEKRRKKLLLADMDSTIVSSETLDDLAEYAGFKDEVSEITERAMEGLIDFHGAIRQRVALLQDMNIDKLEETLTHIQINSGANLLVRVMKEHGATCILVSGGFTFFTSAIARQVGFDIHHGNTLEIDDQKLTGRVVEPIQDKHSKLQYLRQYCESLGISADDVISVGDGANDIPMLKTAGLGIGYYPKNAVRQEIDNYIIHGDLTALLYAQGYTGFQTETSN